MAKCSSWNWAAVIAPAGTHAAPDQTTRLEPSGSSRDVAPERPTAGAARQGRRPEGIPLGFQGSRTTHGGDRRSPISGGTLREGPLMRVRPEFEPTLPTLVRRRTGLPERTTVALLVLAVVLVAAAA